MDTPLLAGMFAAWTAVQLALGVFFTQAYLSRRREREYLLFGLLCLSLAITDLGLTASYALTRIEHWPIAAGIANFGATLSSAVNLHFVSVFVGRRLSRRAVTVLYAVAAVLIVLVPLRGWSSYEPLTVEVTHPFGIAVNQVFSPPRLFAPIAYALMFLSNGLVIHWLVRAYRTERRETLGILVGFCVVMVLAINDFLVALALVPSIYLAPYGFLIYGFGFANTLLVRYRYAAEELEATTDELRRATEELRSSYVELSDVQQELLRRRQLASVGELAASIAHEVRNPLAVIGNAAANLRRPRLTEEDRRTLFQIVQEEIERLNGLVTELLRFARPVNVQRSEVVLAELVDALRDEMKEDCEVVFAKESDSPAGVWADPSLLRIALCSLIENAQQASAPGGRIVVRASPETQPGRRAVRIEVVDTGSGMDSVTLERALDPFYTTRPRGTGLGLPIVQRIVEAHGGSLKLDSVPGEGTRVALTLPDNVTDPMARAAAARLPEAAARGGA